MVTVVAQGTFDLLHPGHIYYLESAAALGDELYVIVARRTNVTHKPAPIVPGHQRRDVLAALSVVDHAILGDESDIFKPIEQIEPDIIALGYDQQHDPEAITAELRRRGLTAEVVRAPALDADDALLSTGRIIDRICSERC